jgi:hypothetical protein
VIFSTQLGAVGWRFLGYKLVGLAWQSGHKQTKIVDNPTWEGG